MEEHKRVELHIEKFKDMVGPETELEVREVKMPGGAISFSNPSLEKTVRGGYRISKNGYSYKLAMTRTLGDFVGHPIFLSYRPSISLTRVNKDVTFTVVVGTDGFWDNWRVSKLQKFFQDPNNGIEENIKQTATPTLDTIIPFKYGDGSSKSAERNRNTYSDWAQKILRRNLEKYQSNVGKDPKDRSGMDDTSIALLLVGNKQDLDYKVATDDNSNAFKKYAKKCWEDEARRSVRDGTEEEKNTQIQFLKETANLDVLEDGVKFPMKDVAWPQVEIVKCTNADDAVTKYGARYEEKFEEKKAIIDNLSKARANINALVQADKRV